MLRNNSIALCRRAGLHRSYATATSPPHALVFLEHRAGVIDSGSLSALTAAEKLGGQVSALVVGSEEHVPGVVEQVKKLKGVTSVLHSTSPQYAEPLPEVVSPLFETLLSGDSSPYTHVVSATSSAAKSLLPRISAKLDAPTVSDVTSLEHDAASGSTTFTRPIYAGNAIATVRAPSSLPIKFFTVRGTAFPAASSSDTQASAHPIDAVAVPDVPTQHLQTTIAKSDRPELGVAARVVSGGRALKNADTFAKTLYPLADALGAAVGASRAAVDAGYADNSLQVGQTGKVVAPELYIAVGISGAIQHLAGMKDSKLIVAINKDPDAPIFQVADVGLVGDLFEVVPELTEKVRGIPVRASRSCGNAIFKWNVDPVFHVLTSVYLSMVCQLRTDLSSLSNHNISKMADTVPVSTHPPAIKVGGRRLSTTSRPTKPHSAHIDPTSPTDNDPNPTDYPRPTTHAQAQADTDHPLPHHNEDEHPKKDKKTHDIPTPAAQRKLDMTRPTRDFASSNKGYNGAGIRIAQPAGKGLGV